MSDIFPTTLLHAIDRWQKGGDHAAKMKRGQRIKQEVLGLNDVNFRWCPEVVYRRVALPQSFIWTFITSGVLPETISAWTLDPDVAKGLKGGVPPEWRDGKRWRGVILEHKPKAEEVVVNLDALWMDIKYQRSLREAGADKYAEGIRRYENSQREVVLDLARVSLKQIWSWGGYSSSIEELTEMFLGAKPTPEQIDWVRKMIEENDIQVGARWISSSGARNVTLRVIQQAQTRGLPVPQDPAFLP
jgi:hypothetical protein